MVNWRLERPLYRDNTKLQVSYIKVCWGAFKHWRLYTKALQQKCALSIGYIERAELLLREVQGRGREEERKKEDKEHLKKIPEASKITVQFVWPN